MNLDLVWLDGQYGDRQHERTIAEATRGRGVASAKDACNCHDLQRSTRQQNEMFQKEATHDVGKKAYGYTMYGSIC
jgi:hypothetical protein